MLGFLKIFLQGILYVVLSPVLLVILAFYFVYCVIIFIYMAIRSVIVFFTGGTPLGDLKEEVEAKRILMEREQAKANAPQAFADAIVQSQMQIAQMYAQQNVQTQPLTPAQPTIEEMKEEDISTTDIEAPSFDDEVDEEKIEEYLNDDGNAD